MEIYISDQLASCLAFSLLGVFAGILYDIVRTLRFILLGDTEHGKVRGVAGRAFDLVFDILYMLCLGVSFSLLAYCYSYGKLRVFNLVCFAVAFWLYRLTLGRLYAICAVPAVNAAKKLVSAVLKLVLKPLKLLFKTIKSFIHLVYLHTVGKLILRIRKAKEKSRFNRVLSLLDTDVRF